MISFDFETDALSGRTMRVTPGHFKTTVRVAFWLVVWAAAAQGQSVRPATATLTGHVSDSKGAPVVSATVVLQRSVEASADTRSRTIHTDSDGSYRFADVAAGTYTLRAEMNGFSPAISGAVSLAAGETRELDLTLAPAHKPASSSVQAPEFYDEPQFTVAGVTQATSSGGHGPETRARATEALAKATASLSQEVGAAPETSTAATEASLREAIARNPGDPQLHRRLGGVEEALGHPLEAVREYQRAAEIDSSEPSLFDWGTELLTHRALEPATEVLTKGNRLYPKSVRMLVALGVVWYARGSNDRAAQSIGTASDLAPENPVPYEFLGKIQAAEATPLPRVVERFARFAQLHPENAEANYYYAVSLRKQPAAENSDLSPRIEELLKKAVGLDPKLGRAHLQLGILYAQRGDFPQAISCYQTAIEASPDEDETQTEAHYRLAQAYLRTREKAKAKEQLKLHEEFARKTRDDRDRERRQIEEFVISLRNKESQTQPQP